MGTMPDTWYTIVNVDEVASPALVVYPQRVRENVRRMIALAGGTERLRPHVKTHKMAEVIRMQLDAGIERFKCATIAEAEMVSRAGGRDVLWAYQPVGPNAARFCRLAAAFPQVQYSTIADDASAIAALSRAAVEERVTVEVLLDIDNGLHRAGIAPGPQAVELYRQVASSPGLKPGGLHVYDGHIRDVDLNERIAHAQADFSPVDALRRELLASGWEVPRVVAGGTPTFPVHARRSDLECSPGTCIFWDAGYGSKFPDLDFLHAALVLTRVVSKPGAGRLCLDLGYKAIAPDNPPPRVQLLDLPDAKTLVHNEEHLAVESPQADRFCVGDVLYGVPIHICPTCALYSEAIVIDEGLAGRRWAVAARDRKLTF